MTPAAYFLGLVGIILIGLGLKLPWIVGVGIICIWGAIYWWTK